MKREMRVDGDVFLELHRDGQDGHMDLLECVETVVVIRGDDEVTSLVSGEWTWNSRSASVVIMSC